MTAKKILACSLALLGIPEGDAGFLKTSALTAITAASCELFAVNNAMRTERGKQPLEQAVQVSSLEDEVDYELNVIYGAMIYGVAAALVAEDDLQRAVYFRNLYVAGAADCTRVVKSGILDVYGGAI